VESGDAVDLHGLNNSGGDSYRASDRELLVGHLARGARVSAEGLSKGGSLLGRVGFDRILRRITLATEDVDASVGAQRGGVP
jgi:hypothetical protein